MTDFPRSAEEFYRLRDDRTNQCVSSREYQNVHCVVYLSPAMARTAAAQVMLLVSANLLSRWCRRVTLVMPPVQIHPSLGLGSGDLGGFVLDQMCDADPFGDFRSVTETEPRTGLSLCIGYGSEPRPSAAVFINASGWLTGIANQPIELPSSDDSNRIGAIAAACLGIGQLFKMAVGMQPEALLREGVFDVYSMNWSSNHTQAPWPTKLDIGRVLMVGAGSVGSSAAYCMRMIGLAGQLSIIDKDHVEIENFNRSPIFGRRTYNLPKAEAVVSYLAGSPLDAAGAAKLWNEFIKERGRGSFDFDIWLPLANEQNVRHSMQHNVPPLMVHASTTANWGVNHGRHIPGRDDCLIDRFGNDVSSEDLTCATGPVETGGIAVDAALPFASLFAGLLIAADLVRVELPGYPQVPNFALFDWFGPMDVIQAWDLSPRAGCACRGQTAGFHDRFNGSTRHRRLFGFV